MSNSNNPSLKKSLSEKRQKNRLSAQDLFLVEFKHNGKILYDKGFGCDLSITGAKFNTLIPFQKGDTLGMILRFSPEYKGARQVEFASKIVRSHQPPKTFYRQVACQFLDKQDKSKQALENFLHWIQTSEVVPLKQTASEIPVHRRIVPRVTAQDAFLFEFKKDGKKLLYKGYGCDLSTISASFMTMAPMKKKEKLDAIIHFSPEFPGPKNLELQAEVHRIEPSRKGAYARIVVRFHDQKGLVRWIIQQFIDWIIKTQTAFKK